MKLTDVTVILPTRNEQANIGAFLASLDPAVSLIVVDASDDATPELVMQLRPRHSRVRRVRSTIAAARQIGAEEARTPWLLFTDADVTFAPDYFQRLCAYGRGGGTYGPKLSQGAFAGYYRLFSWGQRLAHRLGIPAASGSNILVHRAALRAVGGFDLDLTCNEDSEIMWRIQRHGFPVYYAPDLVVYERDHRRLRRGVARKTLHSLSRCLLLYLGLMPNRWRRADWGYWSQRDSDAKHSVRDGL